MPKEGTGSDIADLPFRAAIRLLPVGLMDASLVGEVTAARRVYGGRGVAKAKRTGITNSKAATIGRRF